MMRRRTQGSPTSIESVDLLVLDGSIPVESDLSARILGNPSQYYVKLHSLKFPGGAIRGQLQPCGD